MKIKINVKKVWDSEIQTYVYKITAYLPANKEHQLIEDLRDASKIIFNDYRLVCNVGEYENGFRILKDKFVSKYSSDDFFEYLKDNIRVLQQVYSTNNFSKRKEFSKDFFFKLI